MLKWLAALVHSSNPEVDSLIVGGMAAILGLVAYEGWSMLSDPHSFNPLTYGGGAASILGGLGGARRLRDGCGDGEVK